tara:strand:- start:41 stop:400 length:360 start_codon:yes stop_codon:yes gene_type:complete
MKLFNKYIKIIIIASIAFMQTSNALASIFSSGGDNYIQICTINGLKLVSSNSLADPENSFVKSELMSCCLDVHSNFIINSYTSINQNYFIYYQSGLYRNSLISLNFKNKLSIRAPPVST